MSDDDNEETEEPAVELGSGPDVEGAPLSRVTARLTWGIEHSTVVDREGDTAIRTPEGPQELTAVLEDVEQTYFADRHEFEAAVRDVVGTGPVPTE